MGTLGKDLFRYDEGRFEFTVLFSDDGYEIDGAVYLLGELTTAFLNYDATDFFSAVESGRMEDIKEILRAMPLFGSIARSHRVFTLEDCAVLDRDLRLIQERYAWLLREMFHRDLHLRTPNRYATQLEENGMSALVSGVSLGLASGRDPVSSAVQFEVRLSAEDREPRLKMVFTRLADFIYVELFRAMARGNCPRPCRNCGTWYLKEKNNIYEYCANPAPRETDKTCRDVGATASFQSKVRENDVWKFHQRAYKKYYARVLKKTMSKTDFNLWAQEAENLRKQTLKEYDAAQKCGGEYVLTEYEAELNRL